ncbi:MAG: hypothetical protein ACM3JJ_10035 [Hyphomicrobiales bacterium]
MHRLPKLAALVVATAGTILLSGCNSGSNPMAPDNSGPPPVTIKTPTGLIVSSIAVTKWPSTTLSGAEWDVSIFPSARRPDLYVVLTEDGHIPDYTSNVITDSVYGTVYTFTKSYSVYDGALPTKIPYDTSRRVYVMDQDVGGDPDRLGWITVNVPKAYQNDNASAMDYTYTDSGNRLSVRVRGTWTY